MIMKFSVGDNVVILVDHPPHVNNFKIAPNTTGKIVRCCGGFSDNHANHYGVRSTNPTDDFADFTYDFYEYQLDFTASKYALPPPEFDLEDIELAEILMEEMK